MTLPAETSDTRQTRLAILYILIALGIAALIGAIMKLLADDLSVVQITWFRFSGYALIMLPIVLWKFNAATFKPGRPVSQVFRGLTMASSNTAFIYGARTVDYADAIAILYAYPFLLTVFAIVFLKERVQWAGWFGVASGFVGVLLVMRPDFEDPNVGALFVFLCAVIVSIQMTLNRSLGATSHPMVTSLWGAATAALVVTPFALAQWQMVDTSQVWLIVALITLGAFSQTLLVYAFSLAKASTLAPFSYFEIIAAVVIGLAIFGTWPDVLSWVGIAVIIVSGLLVARTLKGSPAPRKR